MANKRNKEGNLARMVLGFAAPILISIMIAGSYINDKVRGIERIYSGPVAQCYTIDNDGDGNPDVRVEQRFAGVRFGACVPVTKRYNLNK